MTPTNPNQTQDMDQLQSFLSKGIQLPPQPSVIKDITDVLNNPRSGLTEVAHCIQRDPGLTAAIFRTVNTPAFGRTKRTDNLEQAVMSLGLSALLNLVKAVALRSALGGKPGKTLDAFWERAQDTALLASLIARRQVSACNIAADQAYLSGLFHESGIPVMMERFDDYAVHFKLDQGADAPSPLEEDRRYGTDHVVIGYLLARHWQLPEFVCGAIRLHRDAPPTTHAAVTLAALLSMADHLHRRISMRPDPEDWSTRRVAVCEEIGLGSDQEEIAEFEEEMLDAFRNSQT